MAKTYLQLANFALKRFNESVLSTVSGQRGFHAFILDAVNDSIRMINAHHERWPFNYVQGTNTLTSGVTEYSPPTNTATIDWNSFFIRPVELVTNGEFTSDVSGWTDISTGTGVASYVSTGNGRLNLTGASSGVGAATQAITTVVGITYKIRVKIYGGTVVLKVGTTSGGADVLAATDIAMNNLNRGTFYETTFTATSVSSYITFSNSANADYQVDSVSVKEYFTGARLAFIEYDEYLRNYREYEFNRTKDGFDKPRYITRTPANTLIVHPASDLEYYMTYDTWAHENTLSAADDTVNIPDRFVNLITDGATWLGYAFRDDMEMAAIWKKKYEDGLDLMRNQLIPQVTMAHGNGYGVERSVNG